MSNRFIQQLNFNSKTSLNSKDKMTFCLKMRSIQDLILEYLDNEEENNQNFSDLVALLTHQENITDVKDLKPILFLISKITKNHHRSSFFFEKIKKIINFLKNPIKQLFSNSDIFNIFKKNRRILLLLIELEIIKVDSAFSKKLQNYGDYFYPEIKDYIKEEETKELPEQFEEKRRIGENDSYLCDLIRNDKIEDFIAYYNRSRDQISLTMTIAPSIFETNQFLLKNQNPTLIEYFLAPFKFYGFYFKITLI